MLRRYVGKGKLMWVGHTFYLSRGDAGEVVELYMDFNFKNHIEDFVYKPSNIY